MRRQIPDWIICTYPASKGVGETILTWTGCKTGVIDSVVYNGCPEADVVVAEFFGRYATILYSRDYGYTKSASGYLDRKDLNNLFHFKSIEHVWDGNWTPDTDMEHSPRFFFYLKTLG